MRYFLNPQTQQVESSVFEYSDVHTLFKTREEAEASGMTPAYLAQLLKDSAVPGSKRVPNRKQLWRTAEMLECLDAVRIEMDGEEWSADTCETVGNYLSAYGLDIRPPHCEKCNGLLPAHDSACTDRGV
jgi:hypothetical protein